MNINARKEAVQAAQHWISKEPVFIDTETTGTGPNDSIIEISVIDHDGSVLVDSLVKPVGSISPQAKAVHGITEDMIRQAPRWDAIWADVETAITNRTVGIYNKDFDLRLMEQSHRRNWLRWTDPPGTHFFCIMKLYAQFHGQWNPRYGNYRWQSLDQARAQCKIPLPNSHRSRDDTLLARALLEFMANQ